MKGDSTGMRKYYSLCKYALIKPQWALIQLQGLEMKKQNRAKAAVQMKIKTVFSLVSL